jgi:hypothetical protein
MKDQFVMDKLAQVQELLKKDQVNMAYLEVTELLYILQIEHEQGGADAHDD